MTEKHGAIWLQSTEEYLGRICFEEYIPDQDVLVIVFSSADGNYNALLFEKSSDPQWALPFWSERTNDSIYPDIESAIEYLRALLGQSPGTDDPVDGH